MSSEIINRKLIEDVIGKIKKDYSLSDDKDVAKLIGISAQNFSTKKKKGTVVKDILDWAIAENKDLNFLFKENDTEGVVKNKKLQILDKLEEWISEEIRKNPKKEIWFEIELQESFSSFADWMKRRDQGDITRSNFPVSKVA